MHNTAPSRGLPFLCIAELFDDTREWLSEGREEPPPSGRSAVPLQPYLKTRGIFLADEGHQYLWTITLANSAQILSRVVYLLLISEIPIRRHALSHTPLGGGEVSNTVGVLHIAPIHLSVCTIAPTKEGYTN